MKISVLAMALLVIACTAARADVRQLVDQAADAAGVPRHIAHAVIRQESNYRPQAYNAGAIGLGQILCSTAHGIGYSGPCSGLYDPATNLRWSMKYLALALAKGGAGCAGVSLYQTGIYARQRCSAYGRQVMGRAGQQAAELPLSGRSTVRKAAEIGGRIRLKRAPATKAAIFYAKPRFSAILYS